MKILLSKPAEEQIKAAVLAVHPQESYGMLIGDKEGDEARVDFVYACQLCKRWEEETAIGVTSNDEEDDRVEDFFGDRLIGDFHSHPDEHPVPSNIDVDSMKTDLSDGDVSIIVSVWPSKKKNKEWNFRFKGYWNNDGKIKKAKVLRGQ